MRLLASIIFFYLYLCAIKTIRTMKKAVVTLLLCVAWTLTAGAQHTVESIRKQYQGVHEWIAEMSDNFPSEGITSEYFDLHITKNLPASGPHDERIRLYHGELESGEEGDPYPPRYLRFATAKYNYAAREYYEEYLYDDKGNVLFVYAITPDVDGDMTPYELRMWYDGKRLLRFTVKKPEKPLEYIDLKTIKKATFKEVYAGKTIPEKYESEVFRCDQQAQRMILLFKGIDQNSYLP